MKPIVFTIVGAVMLFFASCKKDTPSAPSPPPTTPKANEINTQLDGQAWSGAILSWAVSGGTRQLNATSNPTSIQIFMPEDTTGTFNASDNVITISYNDGTTTWSNNVAGQVTITANSDEHVEGSFEMTLASYFNSDTLELTSGTFYYKQ